MSPTVQENLKFYLIASTSVHNTNTELHWSAIAKSLASHHSGIMQKELWFLKTWNAGHKCGYRRPGTIEHSISQVKYIFQNISALSNCTAPADQTFLLRRGIAFCNDVFFISLRAPKSSSIEWRWQTKTTQLCETLFYTAGGLLEILVETFLQMNACFSWSVSLASKT